MATDPDGHPTDEILRACDDAEADLLIVGSRGLGKFAGWLLGTVSHAVLSAAPCSVLVVKTVTGVQEKESHCRRILLATDGSEDAAAACNALGKLVVSRNAQVRVLTVVHRLTSSGLGLAATQFSGGLAADEWVAAREFVAGVAGALRPQCKEISTEVREGAPADQIIQCARDWDADLIVLGAKGMNAIKTFLIGSVSQKVAAYAVCSVLVVKK